MRIDRNSFIVLYSDKHGKPALYECGGGASNTGNAQIICSADGSPKKPFYIPTKGQLSNSVHAEFHAAIGDVIIVASHHRRDFDIKLYELIDLQQIGEKEWQGEVLQLGEFSQNSWDIEPDECLEAAIAAAESKATDYHCRTPFFIAKS
ncbi:MAG: hypothetical protein ACKO0Z_15735 [Betaproteobacteria bacterium]